MTVTDLDRTSAGKEVTIRDESLGRSDAMEMLLKLTSLELKARDLIADRVQAECDRRLLDGEGRHAAPLVQPSTEEDLLNGPLKRRPSKSEDAERQITRALNGFESNAFILLIDDKQIENLDEPVHIREGSVVTFLRLTPLVGG